MEPQSLRKSSGFGTGTDDDVTVEKNAGLAWLLPLAQGPRNFIQSNYAKPLTSPGRSFCWDR